MHTISYIQGISIQPRVRRIPGKSTQPDWPDPTCGPAWRPRRPQNPDADQSLSRHHSQGLESFGGGAVKSLADRILLQAHFLPKHPACLVRSRRPAVPLMASTSLTPEDGASGAGPDWADDAVAKQDARPPPRKRRRIVISCTECHRRKQKVSPRLPVRSPSSCLPPHTVRPQVPLHQLRLPQQAQRMQLRDGRASAQTARQASHHQHNHPHHPYPETSPPPPPPPNPHPHPQPNRLPPGHPRRLRRLLPRLGHPKHHPRLPHPHHLPRNHHPAGSGTRPRKCRRR